MGSTAPDARMGFGQTVTSGSRIELDTAFHGFGRALTGSPLFRLPVPALRLTAGPWDIEVLETAGIRSIPGIRELIETSAYIVSPSSDHVGLRLTGPVRHPHDTAEIVSHGVPIGALEILHADELIVLGRYRSLTAGYPIVGVATQTCLPLLGQAGPGRELRFRWVDRDSAVHRIAERAAELRALERAIPVRWCQVFQCITGADGGYAGDAG
ncbi:hypothetical protein [Nocardia sp. BSTN01]|uniref:hypothetical protein n=1 Tax=Nocardia sp. BSTN01 TaxID=2783665 RepID=UPI001E599AB6